MRNILHWLLFTTVSCLFHMAMTFESLLNDFIRHVYIPVFCTTNLQKIIDHIATFAKKPQDQVTLAIQVKITKPSDVARTAIKVARYSKIIEESIGPKSFNCFLDVEELSESEVEDLKSHISSIKAKQSKLKVIVGAQVNHLQKLKIEKAKITPLVICFGNYPSVCGLPPHLLIGTEINFNPPILKTVDYDLFTAFQKYSTSEQRKGK